MKKPSSYKPGDITAAFMPCPKIHELAQIAAAMPGATEDPEATAFHAFHLWMACAQVIHRMQPIVAGAERAVVNEAVITEDLEFPGTGPIPREDFLRKVIKANAADRRKRWNDYIRASMADAPESAITRRMADYSANGIPRHEAISTAALYRQWWADALAQSRSEKASKAATAKKDTRTR